MHGLRARQRRVQLHALAAGGHGHGRVEPVLAQPVRDEVRDRRALVQPGRRARVEVDHQPVGRVDLAARPDAPLRRVQLERPLVRRPHEPGEVVEERQLQLRALVLGARARRAASADGPTSGAPRGVFFSKNFSPATPSGHRIRVTGRSRSWASSAGATLHEVVHDLGLGHPGRRVHDLLQVADPDLAALDVDHLAFGRHGCSHGSASVSVRTAAHHRLAQPTGRVAGEVQRVDDDRRLAPARAARVDGRDLVVERGVGRAATSSVAQVRSHVAPVSPLPARPR